MSVAPHEDLLGDLEPSPEARRARRLLVLLPMLFICMILGTRVVANARITKVKVAGKVASELANRTKSSVRFGGFTLGTFFEPCVQRVEIYRPEIIGAKIEAKAEEACVDRWASAIGSGFRAVRVQLDRPSLSIQGSKDAQNQRSLVDVAPSLSELAGGKSGRAPLREMEFVFDDLKLDWSDLPLPSLLSSGSYGPWDGKLTVQRRGELSAMSVEVREKGTGLLIRGRANPTEEGWDLAARIRGDLAPSFGRLLSLATGLDIRALNMQGRIGAVYQTAAKKLTINLDLEQSDVDMANRNVSSQRLAGLTARQKLRINVDLAASRVWIEDGLIEVNNVPLLVSIDAEPGESSPLLSIDTELKTIPFAKLLASIPGAPETSPLLERLSSSLLFALSFSLRGELQDPSTWEPVLEHTVLGLGPNGQGSGVDHLRGPFDYYPLSGEGRSSESIPVGPGTDNWRGYRRIPYLFRRAIQISEDANFWLHKGVDLEEVKAAINAALTQGTPPRGGSTLSQQLVKNLFLTRERTAMRKIEEALLTLLMESVFSKEELFELYVNIIEWGPGIYGIGPASFYYFGRPPHRLNLKEMAYLASIIPMPIPAHKWYEQASVPGPHMAKVIGIMERLHRLGNIDEDQLTKAKSEPLRFTKPKVEPAEQGG